MNSETILKASLALFMLGACTVDDSSVEQASHRPSGKTVARWNENAIDVLLPTTPPELTRALAMTHIAMHDAANAVRPRYRTYAYHAHCDSKAVPALAAAVAAAEVLKHLRPAMAAEIDSLLAADFAAVPSGKRRQSSIDVGKAAAAAIIALRANDGSATADIPYVPGTGPGAYQPTGSFVMLPGWATVTPFAMDSPSQFVGDGPHVLTSAEYAADYNEVKEYGAKESAVRTPEQTAEARFWIENPPTVFNRVADREIQEQHLDLWEAAQGMALTQIAFADAIISSWSAKYTYNSWRPVTAIHSGDLDDNPATFVDTEWQPLNTTPPFPEYDSAHAVVAAASGTVLTDVFGPVAFTETSTATGIVRSYSSWLQAADISTESRIWGGFHFRDACEDGKASGLALGQHILDSGLLARLHH